MAIKEFVARHIPFSDTAANWESYNPIIGKGERIVVEETDEQGQTKLKTVTGDGETHYKDLVDDTTKILQEGALQDALYKKLDKASIDAELSTESTNPVQNGVVTERFQEMQVDLDKKADKAEILNAATKEALDGHAENTDIHVTDEERAAWNEAIAALQGQVAGMLYEAIKITSFSASPAKAENGSTQTVTLTWKLSKDPEAVTVDDQTIENPTTSGTLVIENVTASDTYSMKATEPKDVTGNQATASATTKITFMDKLYYGVAEKPESYDSAFILSLSEKTLATTKSSGFTLTTGENQYMYYCQPVSMGECTFKVGGFNGGFILDDTIEFTNSTGKHTVSYYIYRSANPNLGKQEVNIS